MTSPKELRWERDDDSEIDGRWFPQASSCGSLERSRVQVKCPRREC